jgi:hypothetical protein
MDYRTAGVDVAAGRAFGGHCATLQLRRVATRR